MRQHRLRRFQHCGLGVRILGAANIGHIELVGDYSEDRRNDQHNHELDQGKAATSVF